MQPKVNERGVKILDANGDEQLEVVDEIRFNRWRFETASDFHEEARWVEADRFHFRIHKSAKEILNGSTATIEVSGIKDNADEVDSDPATEFEFNEYPLIQNANSEYLLSPPFYLVGDVADDLTFNGEATGDNQKNDTTHLGGFGATVTLKLTGDVSASMPYKAMEPIGNVFLKLSYLSSEGEALPTSVRNDILDQFAQIRDIYRQLGIEIVLVGDVGTVHHTERMSEIVADGWITKRKMYYDPPLEEPDWIKELMDNFGVQEGGPYLHCVFTDGPLSGTVEHPAITGARVKGTHYLDTVSGKELIFQAVTDPTPTLAHEVGHGLGLYHTNDELRYDPYYLMSPVINDHFHDYKKDNKRFRFSAPEIIKDSPNFKEP